MTRNTTIIGFLLIFALMLTGTLQADDLNNLEPDRDTFLDSAYPNDNYGTSSVIQILSDQSSDQTIAALHWNLSAIPTGSTVNNVVITFQKSDYVNSPMFARILKFTNNWTETGATYLNVGGTDVDTYSIQTSNTYPMINVSSGSILAMIQNWIDSPSSNYGMGILQYVVNPDQRFIFFSKDGPGGTYGARISINYTPPVTLTGLTISGATSVNENSGAQYTATALWSDSTTSTVTSSASWSENSGYASISSSGYLTTGSVSSNQSVTITASYTSGGVTRSDTHSATIVNTSDCAIQGIDTTADLFQPEDNASNVALHPTVSWQCTEGAVFYRVRVSTEFNSNYLTACETDLTSCVSNIELAPGTGYWIHVFAYDVWGSWSDIMDTPYHYFITAGEAALIFSDDFENGEVTSWSYSFGVAQPIGLALTSGNHTELEDLDAVCKADFGAAAVLGDWNDLIAAYNAYGESFADQIGLFSGDAMVQRDGNRWYTSTRQYFISRHNGVVPSGYLVHAEIGGNFIDLGSYYDRNMPVLCKTN